MMVRELMIARQQENMLAFKSTKEASSSVSPISFLDAFDTARVCGIRTNCVSAQSKG